MRMRFILGEIGVGLWRNLSMTISVVIVTAVSLFFLGSGLLFQRQVDVLRSVLYDEITISVFLCGDSSSAVSCAAGEATQEQKEQINDELASDALAPLIESVEFESKQDAFDNFNELFEGSSLVDSGVTVDQMPESYRIQLVDPEDSQVVASYFQGRAGVETVDDQRDLLEGLFGFLNGATAFAWFLAGTMLVAATLLVATTIRLAAFNRRRETGIMRLVGASKFFIQLPFMLEGIIAATLGAVIASGALVVASRFFVQDYLSTRFQIGTLIGTGDALLVVPILLAVGIVLAGVSSLVTLERYLRV